MRAFSLRVLWVFLVVLVAETLLHFIVLFYFVFVLFFVFLLNHCLLFVVSVSLWNRPFYGCVLSYLAFE